MLYCVRSRNHAALHSFPTRRSSDLPGASPAEEKAARDTLAQFDKGDPGWKVRMEIWVRLVKAGPAAIPVLEEALKKDSPAVRACATQALAVMRGPPAVRKVITDYDLSKLDSARLGQ